MTGTRANLGGPPCPVFIGRGIPAKTAAVAGKRCCGKIVCVRSSGPVCRLQGGKPGKALRPAGQADPAIGGMTGADFPEGKNLAGVFHQPAAVVSGAALRSAPPRRQLRAGLAVVVKRGDGAVLEKAVIGSSRMRARIVSKDEREPGLREIPDSGHAFAHGFEAATGYRRLLHGEAAVAGTILAASLPACKDLASKSVAARSENLLARPGFPLSTVRGIRAERCGRWRSAGSAGRESRGSS